MERDLAVIKRLLTEMGFKSQDARENVWRHEISDLIVFNIDEHINFRNYQLGVCGDNGVLEPTYAFTQSQISNKAFVIARILKAVAQESYKTGRNELRSELGQLLTQEA